MIRRLLCVLAAALGGVLAFGSAWLGSWADENHHAWVGRACVAGAGLGLVVAVGGLVFSVLPRRWVRRVFPPAAEPRPGAVAGRRVKLAPIDPLRAGLSREPVMTPRAERGVSWSETAFVAAVCWALSGVAYGLFAAFDESVLGIWPLLCPALVGWGRGKPPYWAAGAAATLAGTITVIVLLDSLRDALGRYFGEAVTVGSGTTVALLVFTLVQRHRARTAF
ncbi:hypothetical protein ABZ990_24375 [Streptomyces sp. NPDC046203]|uniref:hypothetical protein n=1 Tax=Streptomyces sp. NPDC046203 TaxID=3154602 RepID=UPI0033E14FE5